MKAHLRQYACISLLLLISAVLGAQSTPTVTADFGSRLSENFPISGDIFGAQYSHPMPSQALATMQQSGFRVLRMYGWIQSVYTTRTADWTKLDPQLDSVKNSGMHVLLEMTFTPPWLIPQVAGCPSPGSARSYQVPPSDVATWAKLAQSIVAHVDQKYPGLVTDYEIWNEPELGTFCVSPNDSPHRLSRYLSIYAATAPLIRKQASMDHQAVRIGGPTISSTGAITTWIGALVKTSNTAPYVDFVSFHKYLSGTPDVNGGMLWDKTSPNGTASLYWRVQGPNYGFAWHYRTVAQTVLSGIQPNPRGTLIYMDEFNDDWAFMTDCCRNSPVYSPIFNGLAVVDMLDTVYQGAQRVPDGIHYYSASNTPFCLLGDSNGGCGASNYNTLYPQFILYRLFASPSYLSLASGGWMAKSVSPMPGTSGLAATAFFTQNQNCIVIVNPTSTSYASVTVIGLNQGLLVGHIKTYLLNGSNRAITTSAVTPAANSLKVSVGAYSVVGVSFMP